MKNIIVILTGIALISLLSCNTKAKSANSSQPTPTSQPTVYKGVTNDSCAVEMAFGSYGSGIDLKAFDAVMSQINSKKLKYKAKNIGHEGETRLCMPLTEIKGREKTELIEQLKKIAAEGQLVSVSIR